MPPAVRPAAVVLACTVLALSTAGLGLAVTFRGLAPWNGLALCLIVAALGLGWGGAAHLRHRPGRHPVRRRE
ncbi:hypothetical protein [Arthrobacter agilis]|uniref:hypothetical protein n=1 Tax=Arthrobacter agilis TaxID=37921 RepID=UPI00277F7E80|nr:hypothetical protein [Arthrobacter agilis]MDQ0735232.1 hypothetical protein [Arthrobacter agilis]